MQQSRLNACSVLLLVVAAFVCNAICVIGTAVQQET